ATDAVEIYTQPEKLNETREKIKDAGFRVSEAELVMQPKVVVEIKEKKKAAKIIKLMKWLEDHDDVQKVYANFDISEGVF
ncbi:MAG TPA: YebC/PmpR family DNA-binding transcriptional regulator, partial [Nevskiaceae bacterium]|nr:YebC/PmpR family DNA-binding transcriptional regulator [Nevskiaceae bacterium]